MTDKHDPGVLKRKVRITLESTAAEGRLVRQMEGELFPKGRHLYLRYQEPQESEMGRTVTTVRADSRELRIIRHGDVRIEQTFAPGLRHFGYLLTPHGRLELETVTECLEVQCGAGSDDPLSIRWRYELSVMGEPPQKHSLVLTAVPL